MCGVFTPPPFPPNKVYYELVLIIYYELVLIIYYELVLIIYYELVLGSRGNQYFHGLPRLVILCMH